MTATATLSGKNDIEINENINNSDFTKSNINIMQDTGESVAEKTDLTTKDVVIPKIKGLDTLKDGLYSIDLEKTINDMFVVIKSMETQLEKVLGINSFLEKDLHVAKERIAELKKSKIELENTISRLEEEIPSKRELNIEMDYIINERNQAQKDIHKMKSNLNKMQKTVVKFKKEVGDLSEEKKDVISDVNFLEDRLNNALEEISNLKREIKILKGEKIAIIDKNSSLEVEVKELLEDKYNLIKQQKESKKAISELNNALDEARVLVKKSFYKGSDKKE